MGSVAFFILKSSKSNFFTLKNVNFIAVSILSVWSLLHVSVIGVKRVG